VAATKQSTIGGAAAKLVLMVDFIRLGNMEMHVGRFIIFPSDIDNKKN